jgi:hypothetical protein
MLLALLTTSSSSSHSMKQYYLHLSVCRSKCKASTTGNLLFQFDITMLQFFIALIVALWGHERVVSGLVPIKPQMLFNRNLPFSNSLKKSFSVNFAVAAENEEIILDFDVPHGARAYKIDVMNPYKSLTYR